MKCVLLEFKINLLSTLKQVNDTDRHYTEEYITIISMGSAATKEHNNVCVPSLFHAIRNRKFKNARILIRNSKAVIINCVDFEGHTPLIEACRGNRHSKTEREREQFVNFLLQNGCDISKPDVHGWTAVMYAEEKQHYSIAAKLNRSESKTSCFKQRGKSFGCHSGIFRPSLNLMTVGSPLVIISITGKHYNRLKKEIITKKNFVSLTKSFT